MTLADDQATEPRRTKADRYGHGYIAPTRSSAETDAAKFYKLVAYLRAKEKLTLESLADELGIDGSNVSRRINGHSLDADERKLVLDYIFEESGPDRRPGRFGHQCDPRQSLLRDPRLLPGQADLAGQRARHVRRHLPALEAFR